MNLHPWTRTDGVTANMPEIYFYTFRTNYKFHYFTNKQMILLRKRVRRMIAKTNWMTISPYQYLGCAAQVQVLMYRQISSHCRYILGGVK